ncbi:MAG TPA: amidase family protein, partial [Chloroflexota bacterium]
MAIFDIVECTVAQLHAAYLDGSATARGVTQAYLERIERFDRRGPYLNSIIRVNPRALELADELDAALRSNGALSGPLHGVPVIVKDNLDTAGMPTSSGVAFFRNFVPERDAFVVARLRSAGAIVLAKASLSELSMGLADSINSV